MFIDLPLQVIVQAFKSRLRYPVEAERIEHSLPFSLKVLEMHFKLTPFILKASNSLILLFVTKWRFDKNPNFPFFATRYLLFSDLQFC